MKRKGAHKGIFGQLIKIFGKAKVEEISEKTGIDEYSEKLTLEQHALIMIWHAISDCERLRELCGSLRGEIPKKYGLIEISQNQLSKPKVFLYRKQE